MKSDDSATPEITVTKARNQKCIAEIGLSPTGIPVPCTANAALVIGFTPFCTRHAERAMSAICGRKVSLNK